MKHFFTIPAFNNCKIKVVPVVFILALCTSNLTNAQDWEQMGNTINGEANQDFFGFKGSMSSDGNTIAVGANNNDGNGADAGHVRIFTYNGSDWIQKGSDIDGEAAGDNASRCSLSANGNTVAIGAPLNDGTGNGSGHVRIFDYNGSDWVQRGADIPSDTANDQSGSDVSISANGNRVAIGSIDHRSLGLMTGQVRVFDWNGSAWAQLGSNVNGLGAGDQFGASVRMSADGNTFVAGAPFADSPGNGTGEVRTFMYNGTDWVLKGSLIPGSQDDENFGTSVAISDDGNTIIASAPYYFDAFPDIDLGRTRVFSWNGTAWVQKGQNLDGIGTFDRLGLFLAINSTGNVIALRGNLDISGTNNGTPRTMTYIYNGSSWVQLGAPIEGETQNDQGGFGLSFSDNGETLLVGTPWNIQNQNVPGLVRVYRFSEPLGVNDAKVSNIVLYPNPTHGNFTIDLGSEQSNVTVELYTMVGQLIVEKTYASAKTIEGEIPTSAGVYFVRIIMGDGTFHIAEIIKN